MFLTLQRIDRELRLRFAGDWSVATLQQLQAELAAVALDGVATLSIDTSGLRSLDISSAWALREFVERARSRQIAAVFSPREPEQLQLVTATLARDESPKLKLVASAESGYQLLTVSGIGRRTVRGWHSMLSGLDFVGRVSAALFGAMLRPSRWRPAAIARQIYDTGITAVPIVSLIGFLISVITAYMGAQQLRKFGADIYVVDLVTVGTLREMAVLLTAIIVAGRSGSAFAAEIGAMRLNEEVDALKATGVNPIEVLVVPRILGLIVAMPLLTVIADAVGLAGGALLCRSLLGMTFVQYFGRMNEAIGPMTFWVGIIKAPVFALLIATAGAYRGLQVRGSSRELGRLTTVAVVQAIFLVILADALFAVLFMELDI